MSVGGTTRTTGRQARLDVAVVGGSAAGLHAARLLAGAGLRTAVFDARHEEDHGADRTWIVTRTFEKVLGGAPDGVVVHETDVMRLSSPGRTTDVHLEPADLIVERSQLFRHLASRARRQGADLRFGTRVQDVERSGEAHQLLVRDGSGQKAGVTARHVIGADGVRSNVAEAVDLEHSPAVPLVQAVVQLPEGWDPAVSQVWFEPEDTPYFYWLIPESRRRGALGLIAEPDADARGLLDGFLARRGLEPIDYQANMVALHRPGRRIRRGRPGEPRLLLVGDAAGHVKVTTVGGVVPGLWGAEAAARSIVEGRSYRREIGTLRRELWLHDGIRWVMNRFGAREHDTLLGLLNGTLRRLVGRQSRDEMAPRSLELLGAQPRLLGLGLRALLAGR